MTTYQQLLRNSKLDPIDARLLLQHVLQVNHAWLISHRDDDASEAQIAAFQQLLARRAAGEPVAYLLGEREFYSRSFQVRPGVLIPRPETELLVELALARMPPASSGKLLDLGTGSGIVAVTLALERPGWQVEALDISGDALAVAHDNARQLGAGNLHLRQSDWYSALAADEAFQLIVSNPPYIRADDQHLAQGDLRFEPPGALTDFADGLSCIRQIIAGCTQHLQPQGWLLFEHGYDQAQECRLLLQQSGFEQVSSVADLAGIERVTLGQKPAG